MSATELCTEREVAALVHAFYAKVRIDPVLGPIFNGHVDDWDRHLSRLVDFWSSILRRTGRFTGAPMPKHIALPGLSAALFEHWLALFRETALAQPNRAMGETAYAMAQRIAQSLWYGYQMSQQPDALPKPLGLGAAAAH
ncbi:MAG: group III truncated hemoglobin [Burkholderiaceae bacterium]|nr:group III truncated hemoglobin [Burkholderiaceae bacterium]